MGMGLLYKQFTEGMKGTQRASGPPPPPHHLYLCPLFCLLVDSSRQLGVHLGRQSKGKLLRKGQFWGPC